MLSYSNVQTKPKALKMREFADHEVAAAAQIHELRETRPAIISRNVVASTERIVKACRGIF
jgi:hypothetical protein